MQMAMPQSISQSIPQTIPNIREEIAELKLLFVEKWCMCLLLLGGGRIGANLPETQTIFNAALTIAAQMLRAFQAFLVDNVFIVCHVDHVTASWLPSKHHNDKKYINQRLAIHRCHRWLCCCNVIIPAVLDSSKNHFWNTFRQKGGR